MDESNRATVSTVRRSTASEAHEHPLNNVDPRSIDLPGQKWGFFKPTDKSLNFLEVTTPVGSPSPRPRKYVHVNLTTGVCTSYVLDRKISDVPAMTKSDIERCVEELHMMHICVGGPPASKYPPTIRSNAHVDSMGNWRHNACKIVAAHTGLPCKACESIEYELAEMARAMKQTKSNGGKTPKRVIISNLSHRKQSQITALRKRRQSWYRKRREAEKEMKLIEDMITEISEEPDRRGDEEYDDDDDDD